jgi:NAD(P)-dependent dehydrogenase (short-subunit alcohol dehydrogenase family)
VIGMGLFGSKKRSRDAAAVITGAGSGIGAAFATELARRGGRIVCSDIDETAAHATADAIINDGGNALAVRCDVTRIDEVHRLANEAQDWFGGPPTLVINNAGVGAGGTVIGETSLDDWNWVLSINLWGPIHGCHVFTPILREARYGGIINVASAAAFGAAPGMAAYNVSKAGVLSLSETLAAELSGSGVNVTVLCPTFVKTNILISGGNSGRITAQSTQLADRLMRWTGFSPERVARMCLDTNDRGGLYCMPQPDARIGWGIKRFTPTVYTRAAGIANRVTT